MERLSALVLRVIGENPGPMTLAGTNTYIVGSGRHRVLIDTSDGNPRYLQRLESCLALEGIERIDSILITHGHWDHVGGVSALQARWGVTVFKKPGVLDPPDFVPLKDHMIIKCQGATLRVVETPGHCADHVAFLLEEEKACFIGDCVLGVGSAVFDDFYEYMRSLAKVSSLEGLGRLYPGHGPVVEEGKLKIEEYIKHRVERESQILRVLESRGALPLEEIVRVVYPSLESNLFKAASGNVVHHLEKLVKDDRVVLDDSGRWNLKPTL